jgi:hypothetical protein
MEVAPFLDQMLPPLVPRKHEDYLVGRLQSIQIPSLQGPQDLKARIQITATHRSGMNSI